MGDAVRAGVAVNVGAGVAIEVGEELVVGAKADGTNVGVAMGDAIRVGVAVNVGAGVAIEVGEGLVVGAKAEGTIVGVCDWAGADATFGSEGRDVPDVGEGGGDTGAETGPGESV